MVDGTGCGRAQNDRIMFLACLFVNFPTIIAKLMNKEEGFSNELDIHKNEEVKIQTC